MKTFSLIVMFWAFDAPPQTYVLDYGMSGPDCVAAIAEGIEAIDLDGKTILPVTADATISCELER